MPEPLVKTFGPWPANVESVHDGDTMRVAIDLGFDLTFRTNARLFGINAPELKTAEGKAALAYVQTLVRPGDEVRLLSHGWDKYGGRTDATVTLADGRDLSATILEAGHARPFMV